MVRDLHHWSMAGVPAVLRGEGLVKSVKGRGIYVTAPVERLRPADGPGHYSERISAAVEALRSSAVLAPA